MTVLAATMAETMVQPAPLESVIDWSMTVWVTNIARTYGHVSLTPVNDTKFMDICHWLQSMTEIYGQTCQKVSLTAVNDKKKCHWLDVYYIWKVWKVSHDINRMHVWEMRHSHIRILPQQMWYVKLTTKIVPSYHADRTRPFMPNIYHGQA